MSEDLTPGVDPDIALRQWAVTIAQQPGCFVNTNASLLYLAEAIYSYVKDGEVVNV